MFVVSDAEIPIEKTVLSAFEFELDVIDGCFQPNYIDPRRKYCSEKEDSAIFCIF